jgi:hypothetical protein
MLGDRGFCGFGEYFEFTRAGIHAVMRQVQRLKIGVGLRIIERFSEGDMLLEWRRCKAAARNYTREEWDALPETILVRQIFVVVDVPGFRTQRLWLLTTLLDRDKYPPQDFAQLYRRRWEAELNFRSIKIALRMEILRCKTPAMVRKEVYMYSIAYNLIRAIMVEAAMQAGAQITRLSFAGAASAVREWSAITAREKSMKRRRTLYEKMLHSIAADLVPYRPNRTEPRAKKRRPKCYPHLTKPRHQYQEIRHRNRYTKLTPTPS